MTLGIFYIGGRWSIILNSTEMRSLGVKTSESMKDIPGVVSKTLVVFYKGNSLMASGCGR